MASLRVGIDFDNTIACYDRLFVRLAGEMGFLPHDGPMVWGKRGLRDWLRMQPQGEEKWRLLQGLAYGPRMAAAEAKSGVDGFLRRCRDRGVTVYVVSHKTRFANYGQAQDDLREAARRWMAARGFFDAGGFGISREQVYFESTREEKIARISEIAPDYFIDDLEEVLGHPGFPVDRVNGILYCSEDRGGVTGRFQVIGSWEGIGEAVFGASEK